jgi:hypothetical protein
MSAYVAFPCDRTSLEKLSEMIHQETILHSHPPCRQPTTRSFLTQTKQPRLEDESGTLTLSGHGTIHSWPKISSTHSSSLSSTPLFALDSLDPSYSCHFSNLFCILMYLSLFLIHHNFLSLSSLISVQISFSHLLNLHLSGVISIFFLLIFGATHLFHISLIPVYKPRMTFFKPTRGFIARFLTMLHHEVWR